MLHKKQVGPSGKGRRVHAIEFSGVKNSSSYIQRHEQKFEVGPGSAAFLSQEIVQHLPIFEFQSGFPFTYITTVYYDTPDRAFYRQAEQSYDDNIKVRVKEYCYRNRQGHFLTFPYCFVELKERRGGTVYKRRFPLPKEELEALCAGRDVWTAVQSITPEGSDFSESYEMLQSFLTRHELVATSIINYRRAVFQRSEYELRVTFDDEIGVYDARPLYEELDALSPMDLGEPVRRHEKVILEVKCKSPEYPAWLQEALRHHHSKRLSKFTSSVRSLTDSKRSTQNGQDLRSSPTDALRSPADEDIDETSIINKPIED